jgi:hypothetical protein
MRAANTYRYAYQNLYKHQDCYTYQHGAADPHPN